jgi:hypothetical protein
MAMTSDVNELVTLAALNSWLSNVAENARPGLWAFDCS